MNQILVTKKIYMWKKHLYLFILSFSLIVICFIIIFQLILHYNQKKYNNISKNIKKNFNIETIYTVNHSDSYKAIKISNNIFVIGVIRIPKINIEYPIISESSDDLLKISVCKFSGPNVNCIGNLSIVRTQL